MKDELVRLQQWGCDVIGSLPRFVQDEEFLMECIEEVARDPAFDTLGAQLERGELRQAFDTAHMLKGIIANTGLTPLLREIVGIVEPLRAGSDEGAAQHYTLLMSRRSELLSLLRPDEA